MKQLLILIIVLYLLACKNPPSEETERKDGFTSVLKTKKDSLYHQVMQGHDIGMAKMSKLRGYLNQVQRELDSINKFSPRKIDGTYQHTLLELQEQLSYADHAMFTWMGEFKYDSASGDTDKRIMYLEAEKLKVEKVRDNILKSLQRADSLFGK